MLRLKTIGPRFFSLAAIAISILPTTVTASSAVADQMAGASGLRGMLLQANAALRSSDPSPFSWALLPIALAPLILLIWMFVSFLRDQPKKRITVPEIVALAISLIFSTLIIFADVYSMFSAWIDPDDVGELARVISLADGQYFPIQGTYIHMWQLFIGPFATMWIGLFAQVFENHAAFAIAPLVTLLATQVTGAAFLRRRFSSTASLMFILVVPLHMAFMMSSSAHVVFGIPLGILIVWIMTDAIRENTWRHIPLAFLCAGLMAQFYAVNIVWLATIPALLILFGRPTMPVKGWIRSSLLFLLPQVFTIFMALADLCASKPLAGPGGQPASTTTIVAFLALPVIALALLLATRTTLHRHKLVQRAAETPHAVTGATFAMHSMVLLVPVLLGMMDGTYFTFALPGIWLAIVLLATHLLSEATERYAFVRRRLAMALVISTSIVYVGAWCFHNDGCAWSLLDVFNPKARIGEPLMAFLEDAGMSDRQEYRENIHHLHQVTVSAPLYPMFFLPPEDEDDGRESLEIVFLPRRDSDEAFEDPFEDSASAQMFSHDGLEVLAYDSRLKYHEQKATVTYRDRVQKDLPRPWLWKPRPLMGDMMVAARALLEVPSSASNDPARMGFGANGDQTDATAPESVRVDTVFRAGQQRTLALLVSTRCPSTTSVDGLPVLPLMQLDYPEIFEDGAGYRVELYELGSAKGTVGVDVDVSECRLKMLDLLDPPMKWQTLVRVLLEHGFTVGEHE